MKRELGKHDFVAQFQQEQLHRAARNGDVEEVERLIAAKYPLNRFDSIGKTPLHYAARENHYAVVARLISAGANVNAHDERQIGNTPLSDIAGECTFQMPKQLIDAGADPRIKGWMQLSAVDRAAKRKDVDAVKIQRLLKEAAQSLS
jgi:ankyrin repeat protein